MPRLSPADMLTTPEVLALREALSREDFVIGFSKVLAYDARLQADGMKDEALKAEPNLERIVQFASRMQVAQEFVTMLKNRIEALTVRQSG